MKKLTNTTAILDIKFIEKSRRIIVYLNKRLEATNLSQSWQVARQTIVNHRNHQIIIDASAVEYCDGAGIAMLFNLCYQQNHHQVTLIGLQAQFKNLLAQFDAQHYCQKNNIQKSIFVDTVGRVSYQVFQNINAHIIFIGQLMAALFKCCFQFKRIRWQDVGLIIERSGFNAIPIVSLIAFILGIILAFQSAVAMKQFGVEIFVADLVGLALFRELSPLLTTILLAGRSGAAFAAEVGTMKINEEVNALTTMGIDPIEFLVLPRLIATTLTTPLLVIIADSIGILGGAVAMIKFDVPMHTFIQELFNFVRIKDFSIGVLKGTVFGFIIAFVGCMKGFSTKSGALAVGQSTTSAVVNIIVLVVILDGLFAILLTQMKI